MDSHPQPQSSFILGLRSLTMLAGLVAVPLAAIFGSSLPEFVKQWGGEQTHDDADSVTWNTTPRPAKAEAPRFDPFSAAAQPQPPANTAVLSGFPMPATMPAAPATGDVIHAGASLPTLPPPQVPTQQPPAPAAANALPGSERFTWMERRLRDLGATYYLLEAWGTEGGLFRFHCKMAIAGNPQQSRPFEAIDPDPLRAMERVLAQIEASRLGP